MVVVNCRYIIFILIGLVVLSGCTTDHIEQGMNIPTDELSKGEHIEHSSVDLIDAKDSPDEDYVEDVAEERDIIEKDHNMQMDIDSDIDSDPYMTIEEQIAYFEEKYTNAIPSSWGEMVDGVITHIDTEEKIIALTFDACGGSSDGYDRDIIDFLIHNEIPATLFINSNWIDKYPNEFLDLVSNPLFEIANHGYKHRPLSVNGKSVYGIAGTHNIREVVEEILLNDEKIYDLTGKRPRLFRSGTAYYDEIAVEIAHELGYQVVNFNVLGDAGATYTRDQIVRACASASPGAIILFHMNRPEANIAEGIIEGITELKDDGYTFMKLSDLIEKP